MKYELISERSFIKEQIKAFENMVNDPNWGTLVTPKSEQFNILERVLKLNSETVSLLALKDTLGTFEYILDVKCNLCGHVMNNFIRIFDPGDLSEYPVEICPVCIKKMNLEIKNNKC